MTRAADGIARGAQEQAGGVQRTSDLIGEMGMLVEQVGQGARLVSEANDKVTQAARHGVSAIEQTGRGMESIRNRTIAAADKVKEMGVRSKEIGRIVETIDDIADKTDMLALNAAVEAARAGEHGRGFAVVADQVRKLSEDSKGATRDIGELIERVQETVREAIAAMENTMTEVGQGTRLAEETTRSLGEILRAAEDAVVLAERIGGAVEQLKRKSEGVATAIGAVSAVVEENTAVAEEMAASSQQVMEAVESVVSVAEENSASAEEVSAAAEEMSAQVEEVTASAQELSQLAEQLRRAVARFRLAEAGLVQPEWSGQGWEMAAVPADHPQAIQVGYRGNGRNT
jgi:methyl-accepting chemotaxis protein